MGGPEPAVLLLGAILLVAPPGFIIPCAMNRNGLMPIASSGFTSFSFSLSQGSSFGWFFPPLPGEGEPGALRISGIMASRTPRRCRMSAARRAGHSRGLLRGASYLDRLKRRKRVDSGASVTGPGNGPGEESARESLSLERML